jgi:hypothetical protein
LQSEYDTAEMQTENSLYPNADGTVPDDATMNSSRDGKKKELVAFQEKIRNRKMTKKEESDFHTFVSSVKDIYNASKTVVDTLHTEVAGIDPNRYGTYYTDANKTDTEKNLSAYDKDYKDGKYRDAYTDLTNVKTIYAGADTAKKQAEAALAAKQAEEQAAHRQSSLHRSLQSSRQIILQVIQGRHRHQGRDSRRQIRPLKPRLLLLRTIHSQPRPHPHQNRMKINGQVHLIHKDIRTHWNTLMLMDIQ